MKSVSVKLGVVLIIGIVIFSCAGMRGALWKSFSSTDLYEGFYYVSNPHFLYKGTVRVWVKLEYREKGKAEYVKKFGKDYENLSYSLQQWEIVCPAKTETIIYINQYSIATSGVIYLGQCDTSD
jgi:hypothetical protein